MHRLLLPCLCLFFACQANTADPAKAPDEYPAVSFERPNILWIVAEDLGPYLPSFGDSTITTPNISRLAAEGVRFTHFFSPSGVCAPSRAAISTGMYPSSIGANHMRTGPWYADLPPDIHKEHVARQTRFMPTGIRPYEAQPPAEVKMHGEYMRSLGYYTTNNAKEDYQFRKTLTAWDECSNQAHWRNRAEGQPFFSIFNIGVTHESRIWAKAEDSLWVDEDLEVPIPPYLPDNEIGQRDVRRMYSNIREMDHRVGEILAELEEDGLLEKTIIFWYTDHGGPLPRMKRLVYDSGLRVPMVVRFPHQLQAGTIDNRLTNFIDLLPTLLSLANTEPPAYLQGQAFLGPYNAPDRKYVHAAGDRFDETYDGVRAVRDQRFKYIRHLEPNRPYYVPVGYREQMPVMQELLRMREAGELNEVQAQWFRETRPAEELFDCEADPHEINSLANDPAYAEKLAELRQECDRWLAEIKDVGLMPETELMERFWPGGVQPATQSPTIEIADGKAKIVCETEGASLAYQILEPDSTLGRSWQLYQDPVKAKPGQRIVTVAHRIGYLRSDTVSQSF
jgi:N-sulfoglucosamine sulfohydrolase